MREARVLVLSGRGRYADPWHDHTATSHEIALAVSDLVGHVEVRGTFPDALADLDDFALLVVNAGNGRRDTEYDGDDSDWAAHHEALRRFAAEGGAILGVHQAAATFGDSPHWPGILGGRWVRGVSGHPPFGYSVFEVVSSHPAVAGLQVIEAPDERYCDLEQHSDTVTLIDHAQAGTRHPVVWLRDNGHSRVVYDALGHGVESYRSPSRRLLLRREVSWLLGYGQTQGSSIAQ